MINVDLFEDGERQYINKIAEGRDREKLSRQDILSAAAFAREEIGRASCRERV